MSERRENKVGTKLIEGMVVRSDKFIIGKISNGKLRVGDYNDNDYAFMINPKSKLIDETRKSKEYLIYKIHESQSHITCGNRWSSYENEFYAKELNFNGTYNENGEEIVFSTCGVYIGSINENDIKIIKTMRKTYID
jgi:hypothetical protein